MAHDVFLTHALKDRPIAEAACRGLESAGMRCWLASRDIRPHETWAGATVNAINSARLMVLILSAEANESPQVLREVERAVSRGIPIVAFRIEDVLASDDLQYLLMAQQGVDALTAPHEVHIARLVTIAGQLLELPGAASSGGGNFAKQVVRLDMHAERAPDPLVVVELASPEEAERLQQRELHAPQAMHRIEEALRTEPNSFGFFQTVRLLEKLYPDLQPIGALDDPAREVVRFKANASLAFPASEIQQLALDHAPPTMAVNFMGLIGPQAVLPHNYTLLVAERLRARDPALADFLDIFQHRLVSLFYQAWRKHRITIAHEDGRADPLASHLADAIGIGLDTCRDGLPFPDEALVYRAGLLAAMPRGAVALQQLIEDMFAVPAEVEQFIGSWYALDSGDLCELGEDDALTNQLGLGAVAGDEIWDQQTRVRIRIGPLERSRYDEFLPGKSAHIALASLVRFFSHDQFDFELQLVLAHDDVAGVRLGDAGAEYQLGWSTWISSAPRVDDADETILTLRTGAAI